MIRILRVEDVARVLELSCAAGWNQTAEDWRRMMELEPGGCFGLECDGRLVATTTVLCYGRTLAWVGMVLTDREYQRRGFARRLVEAALRLADERGVECVKLDATDQGRPLYQSLGFVDEQPIERWQRAGAAAASVEFTAGEISARLDREAFGADRSAFLARLGEPLTASGGYVMTRPGIRARYLGPCVAADAAMARTLVAGALARFPGESWFWDLLPRHPYAAEIARDLGFAPVRQLMRMVRGKAIATNDALVYAIGGFEAG